MRTIGGAELPRVGTKDGVGVQPGLMQSKD